ncbi:MAG: glutamate--tRNA ligase [Treponema sp.]|jgi:glutamyl-tRNA synthetase|nr:glutamate--tRNA ligase [Treponema sp.]
MEIRDRYAPSPTGLQHIGGVRTALFNYLFARSAGGKFILRLEDTDRARSDPAFVRNLYDTFAWLGLHWDEGPDVGGPAGPYVQSERSARYQTYAGELIAAGRAYYCFCSAERLEGVRKEREAARSKTAHSGEGAGGGHESGYDRRCREIPAGEAAARAAAGEAHTVRLRIPLEGAAAVTRFHDHLLGDIEWKNADVSPDPVLLKSDGFPTYHLANVVDDHLMGISHVLRAQEWLSSTPLHVILYESFGWKPPAFCHLPMVMGQDGKKLSKRHGATSIDEFRRQGCLPEALVNYVALLGCSYGEDDGPEAGGRSGLYRLSELEERFSLDRLNKAPAIFDYKKLEWYNGQYIRMKSGEELAALALPWAVEAGLFRKEAAADGPAGGPEPDEEDRRVFTAAMPLIRERLNFLSEVPGKIGYLFSEPAPPPPEEFFPKKCGLERTVELLRMGRELLVPLAGAPDDEAAEALVKDWTEKNGVKIGDLMMPLRVAVTGARVSPPLFGSLRLLGAERSLRRVDRALAALTAPVSAAPQRPG